MTRLRLSHLSRLGITMVRSNIDDYFSHKNKKIVRTFLTIIFILYSYSTVTDFAKFLGLSTSIPFTTDV